MFSLIKKVWKLFFFTCIVAMFNANIAKFVNHSTSALVTPCVIESTNSRRYSVTQLSSFQRTLASLVWSTEKAKRGAVSILHFLALKALLSPSVEVWVVVRCHGDGRSFINWHGLVGANISVII